MRNVLLVAAGGALGSAARYLVSLALAGASLAFPWATLLVNVAGSFALGLLMAALPADRDLPVRLLLGVGVCGGFTTFSTFSAEVVGLAQHGQGARAAGYLLASVVTGTVAAAAGLALGRTIAVR